MVSILQAMDKLKEPKVMVKVRKSDLTFLKDSLDSIKNKYKKVGTRNTTY